MRPVVGHDMPGISTFKPQVFNFNLQPSTLNLPS